MHSLFSVGVPVRKKFPDLVEHISKESKKKSPPLVSRHELGEWISSIFPDQSEQANLLTIKILHDCGYILNFERMDYVIVDPQWIADFFCTIITAANPLEANKKVEKNFTFHLI